MGKELGKLISLSLPSLFGRSSLSVTDSSFSVSPSSFSFFPLSLSLSLSLSLNGERGEGGRNRD